MSNQHPFGADTLIIPFTIIGSAMNPRQAPAMSRMRPAGGLSRDGGSDGWRAGDDPAAKGRGSTGAETGVPAPNASPSDGSAPPSTPGP